MSPLLKKPEHQNEHACECRSDDYANEYIQSLISSFSKQCPNYVEKGSIEWIHLINGDHHRGQFHRFSNELINKEIKGVPGQSSCSKIFIAIVNYFETIVTAMLFQIYRDGGDPIWKESSLAARLSDQQALFCFIYTFCFSTVIKITSSSVSVLGNEKNPRSVHNQLVKSLCEYFSSPAVIDQLKDDFLDTFNRIVVQRKHQLKKLLHSSIFNLKDDDGHGDGFSSESEVKKMNSFYGLLLESEDGRESGPSGDNSKSVYVQKRLSMWRPSLDDLNQIISDKKCRAEISRKNDSNGTTSVSSLLKLLKTQWVKIFSVPMFTVALFVFTQFIKRGGSDKTINFHLQ